MRFIFIDLSPQKLVPFHVPCWLEGVVLTVFSELKDNFLGLPDGKCELIVCAPLCQPVYFLSVLFFIVVQNQSHHCWDICKFNYCVCGACGIVVRSLQGYSMGLRTEPCGAPMLMGRLGERWVLSLTVCGCMERKPLIHIHTDTKQFGNQPVCRVVNEKHPHICPPTGPGARFMC